MALPSLAALPTQEGVANALSASGFMPGQSSALGNLVNLLRQAITGLSEFVHDKFAEMQGDVR